MTRKSREASLVLGLLHREPKQPATPATPAPGTPTLEKAIEKYLANITALKSEKTADGYQL
jgi:hypothetical protein